MCWCADVSAAFATAEWLSLAWLWRRNRTFDRPFAIALSPIAAQEAVQWLLWEHVAASRTDCDRTNVVASLVIRLVIGLVPLAWVWFARRAAPADRVGRALWRVTLGYVGVCSALIVQSFVIAPRSCTTIGPHHHQAWAGYLTYYARLQPALDVGFFTLYWSLPVAALVRCFRPRWLALAIAAVAVGTMSTSLVLLSTDEVGAMWCWSCSLLILLALAQPRLRAWVELPGDPVGRR